MEGVLSPSMHDGKGHCRRTRESTFASQTSVPPEISETRSRSQGFTKSANDDETAPSSNQTPIPGRSKWDTIATAKSTASQNLTAGEPVELPVERAFDDNNGTAGFHGSSDQSSTMPIVQPISSLGGTDIGDAMPLPDKAIPVSRDMGERMDTGEPLTVEEAMSDELLFRAIQPILKRMVSTADESEGVQIGNGDNPPTIQHSAKRRKPDLPPPMPLPGTPPPPHRDSQDPDESPSPSPSPTPPPMQQSPQPPPQPLPVMPLPSDSEPSSDGGNDSEDDLDWYRDPRSKITLPEFATITQHYLHRRHHLTDEAARDMRDFHEAMKKRRKTLRMIARSEAEKKGEELIRAEVEAGEDDDDSDNEVDLPLLDEELIGRVLDVALADKFEMHTMKIRRAKPLIYEATGIKVDLIHRCPKGCKAFNRQNELTCKFCGSNRFKAVRFLFFFFTFHSSLTLFISLNRPRRPVCGRCGQV